MDPDGTKTCTVTDGRRLAAFAALFGGRAGLNWPIVVLHPQQDPSSLRHPQQVRRFLRPLPPRLPAVALLGQVVHGHPTICGTNPASTAARYRAVWLAGSTRALPSLVSPFS